MKFKLKDPGSAITHGIGMLLAVVGATPLIVKAARSADVLHVFAVSVFIPYHDPSLPGKHTFTIP